MTDAAFRDALEEYRLAFTADKHEPNNGPVPHCAGCDEVRRTRARVLALYAEAQQQGERDQLALAEQVAEATMRMEQGRAERQGEEAVVTDGTPDGQYIELRFVQSTRITDGDKVRVSRIADGEKTI